MRLYIQLRRFIDSVIALRSGSPANRAAFSIIPANEPRSIELYANACRRTLREAGNTFQNWFFDADDTPPKFAALHSIDMSNARGLVHEYIVYFEAHFDPISLTGKLATCTLEVGPSLVRSSASQSESPITQSSRFIPFESISKKHHLRGSAAVNWQAKESQPTFITVTFSLSLIHPGTREITKTASISMPLDARIQTMTCPKCLGEGIYAEMAIPESAYKSGFSGYQIYSENTVCCHVGCPTCGGSGTTYEEWYLKEKPMGKASTSPAIKGFGRITI